MTEAIFISSWASARTVRSVQQGSEAQEPCAVGHPPSARRGAEAGATAGILYVPDITEQDERLDPTLREINHSIAGAARGLVSVVCQTGR